MAYNIVASGTTSNLLNLEDVKTSVNGVLQKLAYINSNTLKSNIYLPTAPNIYPHDTVLTAEQIASGVIKHADASNSGLIVNGKFDVDTSGWTAFGETTISVENGECKITSSGSSNCGASQLLNGLVVGKQYIIETTMRRGTCVGSVKVDIRGFSSMIVNSTTVNSRHTLTFTATSTQHTVQIYMYGVTISGETAYFDNIAVYPADAISRSDLVFLELTTSNAA